MSATQPQAPGRDPFDFIKVHEGLDGWLFLVGGSNRPLDSYDATPARWWRLWRWARLIRARERRLARLGARYLHLVVPEKLSIYPEKAPALGIDGSRSPTLALGRMLRGSTAYVDPTDALLAAKAELDVYLRTDTHWTLEGCHVVYRALCAAAGVSRPLDLATRPFAEHRIVGDLGQKLVPARSESVRRYALQRSAVRTFASPLVSAFEADNRPFALHRGAHVVYRNDDPDADGRRVVLFGDSYAHFEPFLLTGMLAETFRELHFVWSASVDAGYVGRIRPDLVVGEIAERFMFRVPSDRYDIEAFAAGQLAKFGIAAGPARTAGPA